MKPTMMPTGSDFAFSRGRPVPRHDQDGQLVLRAMRLSEQEVDAARDAIARARRVIAAHEHNMRDCRTWLADHGYTAVSA